MANDLGFHEGIIEVKPTGSIQQNGEIICNWIKQSNKNKIIILSISKGSADFKEAVNQADSSFIKKMYVKYLGMKYGISYDAFLSVKTGIRQSVLNEEFAIPKVFKVINIIPAPLERYVTDRAYENLSDRSK